MIMMLILMMMMIAALRRIKCIIPSGVMISLYKAYVIPHLEYMLLPTASGNI